MTVRENPGCHERDWHEPFIGTTRYDMSCRVRTIKDFHNNQVFKHGREIEDDTYNKHDIYVDQPDNTNWSQGTINHWAHTVMGRLQDVCTRYYERRNIKE